MYFSDILVAILDDSKLLKDVIHHWDISKYHTKYENDHMDGYGAMVFHGQTDGHTHTHKHTEDPFQDSTSIWTKWNKNNVIQYVLWFIPLCCIKYHCLYKIQSFFVKTFLIII